MGVEGQALPGPVPDFERARSDDAEAAAGDGEAEVAENVDGFDLAEHVETRGDEFDGIGARPQEPPDGQGSHVLVEPRRSFRKVGGAAVDLYRVEPGRLTAGRSRHAWPGDTSRRSRSGT